MLFTKDITLKPLLFVTLLMVSFFLLSSCSSQISGSSNLNKNIYDNVSSDNKSDNVSKDNGSSGKFDDQIKDNDVTDDFTNPLNFIGRYRIISINVLSANASTVLSESYAEDRFKGNLGVDVDLSSLTTGIVKIKLALKYQFHPALVKSIPIDQRFEFLSKLLAIKPANLNSYYGSLEDKINAIFKDLGAEVVENRFVQFTLTDSDVPVDSGDKMILLLEKIGNSPRHSLIADNNRYWNSNGEDINQPEIPTDNESLNPPDFDDDDIVIPEIPADNVTLIDFNDLSTVQGHYEIIRFVSEANAPLVGKQVVASDDVSKVQRMKGEISIKSTASTSSVISKMQMDSSYLDQMGQGNEKYTFTPYPLFQIAGVILINKDSDKIEPYSAESKTLIKISQSFTKTVSGMKVPVNVSVVARKISDTPKDIVDKPYWGEGSGENDPVKPTITPIDFTNNPKSVNGNYAISNICYKYKRPLAAEENICASNPVTIQKMVGDLSVQYDSGSATNSFITAKTQLQASWFSPLYYTDSRWKFLYENRTKNYTISQTDNKNEIKVTFRRILQYKFVSSYNVDTEINIWATKVSDDYKVIDGSKFF